MDCVHAYYNLFVVRFFLLPLENKTKEQTELSTLSSATFSTTQT